MGGAAAAAVAAAAAALAPVSVSIGTASPALSPLSTVVVFAVSSAARASFRILNFSRRAICSCTFFSISSGVTSGTAAATGAATTATAAAASVVCNVARFDAGSAVPERDLASPDSRLRLSLGEVTRLCGDGDHPGRPRVCAVKCSAGCQPGCGKR